MVQCILSCRRCCCCCCFVQDVIANDVVTRIQLLARLINRFLWYVRDGRLVDRSIDRSIGVCSQIISCRCAAPTSIFLNYCFVKNGSDAPRLKMRIDSFAVGWFLFCFISFRLFVVEFQSGGHSVPVCSFIQWWPIDTDESFNCGRFIILNESRTVLSPPENISVCPGHHRSMAILINRNYKPSDYRSIEKCSGVLLVLLIKVQHFCCLTK